MVTRQLYVENLLTVVYLRNSHFFAGIVCCLEVLGKMLDEKLTIEGCFDIVIYCQDHKFFTQSNGQSTAKSPEGMFPLEMENDLKAVDTAIREYYGLNGGENETA